ncbi:MAG: PDZ domain-containing protein [Gammaproteobacteria bacterium]|nr:PDZ domain-containing protein [Gammaproteobacteria bacterium]
MAGSIIRQFLAVQRRGHWIPTFVEMTAHRPARAGATLLRIGCLLIAATVTACGGGGSSGSAPPPGPTACSAEGQKQTVLDVMQDIYLYNDQLPAVDPDDFATPEALLSALIVNPPDRFTSIGSAAADDAFFGEGQFIGLGFISALLSSEELRIAEVFEGSPADDAGLERGHRVVTINGRTIADINAAEGIDAALGPAEIGVQVDLGIADLQGDEFEAIITKAVVTIPPVPIATVFDVAGEPTGYLYFRTFVEPSFAALDAAFAEFAEDGVRDLIVDVRYNGGGLIAVADFLGNLLGGLDANGQVFSMTVFNANNAFRNTTTLFMNETNSLQLDRLVFITTGATASASELVINSLMPHVEETFLVGSDTFGKPVGSLGFTFCEKIIRPISFETVNSDGDGDYFNGLQADCPAADDLDFVLGDPAEASLAEALFVAENGACSAMTGAMRETASGQRSDISRTQNLWRLLINAH